MFDIEILVTFIEIKSKLRLKRSNFKVEKMNNLSFFCTIGDPFIATSFPPNPILSTYMCKQRFASQDGGEGQVWGGVQMLVGAFMMRSQVPTNQGHMLLCEGGGGTPA